MKLAIISHTAHYTTRDGITVGWSPTVNEINHLLDIFESIVHVAMHYDGTPPLSTMAYKSDKIKFISIPSVGGNFFFEKLNIIWNAPKIIKIVSNVLKQVDVFQLRTPTGIGVFLIPYFTLFVKKKGWYKYAGNWNQEQPPFGYRLQRWMLKHQKRKVTINGKWDEQPEHCISFENPCLTLKNLSEGEVTIKHKQITRKLSFCFVGRLERAKGVERIITAFASLSETEKSNVEVVHLIGDGNEFDYFVALGKNSDVNFKFHRFLSRSAVFKIYKQSHVFLLPTTASEGFPKVIAEAINFGCVPIVSNISSIRQYIRHNENGYIIDSVDAKHLSEQIRSCLNWSNQDYHKLINSNTSLLNQFTFLHYNTRIKNEILTA